MVMDLEGIAEEFALNVAAQTDAIHRGDRKGGNVYAKRYIAAFKKLRDHGEAGRDALATLLTHPRMDVRVNAATCLLSDRPEQAKPILEEAAKGKGMVPFLASRVLKYWEEGTWHLDVD
ncbi:hypothetical protein D187_004211 [Cystobacter fuscus DSM 2262]|uniref:DUF2019 domain-containing protein n=1 Tax=Cystobacter fuscus (strain ATCC 25194 / DSM 2262 / NBRC 100088 / M29) TaxID=1242864 RepID=S9QA36_CYSF2|nr:DUF2019 domain-containing protein [Cystobacter fuscus]EPX58174.1 hypothetical protein D187_004211 [Cystobacter fuscus DSM 2262]